MEIVKNKSDEVINEVAPYEVRTVDIEFGSGVITVPIKTVNRAGVSTKSISDIAPINGSLLLAEYGEVGMMTLLNAMESRVGIETGAKLMVVGINTSTPKHIRIGDHVLLKQRESFNVRPTYDPANDYSFDKLQHLARQDKNLLAAVTIAKNKDASKVGLRIQTDLIDQNALTNLNKNKNMGNLIYKDKILPFINYKLIDYTNIDAIIYGNTDS